MTLERLTQITSVGISSGITLSSATLTGVTTLTTLSAGGDIDAVNGTFSGNLNVAGVLTYEDVSNVDSVGVVTARNTLDAQGNVTVGAGLSVVGVSTLTGNAFVGSAITMYASTGIVSATTFYGDLVGDVTGNINSSGVSTVTTLNATTISGVSTIGVTTATITTLTVNGNNYPSSGALSSRNIIINGDFRINQRGGSNTTINTYALDRWRSYGGPMGFTISQQDVLSSLETSRYALRFQRTAGNTQTNNTGIAQGIESKNCEGLAGTQMTLSFKARKGANLSDDLDVRFFFGTGTDDNPVGMTGQTSNTTTYNLTTSFVKYTKTVTVPAGTTQISIGFDYTPTGTAGADDWFEIAEVQIERGSVATPFEHRSYGDELARCQRYYVNTNWVFCTSISGLNYRKINPGPGVRMRTSPTHRYSHPSTGVVNNVYEHSSASTYTINDAQDASSPGPQGSTYFGLSSTPTYDVLVRIEYSAEL